MVTPFAKGSLLKAPKKHCTLEDLTGSKDHSHVLVIAPHPDDEALGCGAAIAAAAEAGHRLTIVCVTDGALSHPNSLKWPKTRLAALRAHELQQSVDVLTKGTGSIIRLGYGDQASPTAASKIREAGDHLIKRLADNRPNVIWSSWEHDPHIDHKNAAEIAKYLKAIDPTLTLLFYPVWGRFIDAPLPREIWYFDGKPFEQLKFNAMRSHKSQMTQFIDDDDQGFVMTEIMQNHFLSHPELFLKV